MAAAKSLARSFIRVEAAHFGTRSASIALDDAARFLDLHPWGRVVGPSPTQTGEGLEAYGLHHLAISRTLYAANRACGMGL